MENGRHWTAFGCLFFLLHQERLLRLLNAPVIGRWFRYVLRIHGDRSSVGNRRIFRILPNAIFWWNGDKQVAEFRTHAKFSKRIYYAFAPLWWAMHAWDWAIADRWIPELSFGFDTLTKYPDADPETNTVDGSAKQGYAYLNGQPWATIRGAAGSAFQDANTNGWFMELNSDATANNFCGLTRSIFLFNTAALGAGASITAAVLSLYGTNKYDAGGRTPNIDIYTSNPVSNTALEAGDYDSLGTVSQTGSNPISYASFNAAGYNDFTFDATGRGNIAKAGISKFGARNANYDVANIDPVGGGDYDIGLIGDFADQTGTTSDPKLVVTYTPESTREGELLGLTDAIVVQLIAGGGTAFERYISESIGLTDAQSQIVAYGRALTETIGLTDATAVVKAMIRYLADTEGRTDSVFRSATFFRFVADQEGITDQAMGGMIWLRFLAEVLGRTDAQASAKGQQRILSESLGIADAANRYFTAKRYPGEAIGITDAQSRASALRRILADVEGISDTALRRVSFLRTLTEALGIDDREDVQKIISRAIADAVGITDYRNLQQSAPDLLRTIADTLSIADALTVSKMAVIVRLVADNLGVTDARWAAKQVRRILSEALGISDFEDETKQIKRYLEELVGLTDDQERTALIIRRLTETAGISDRVIAGLSQYIIRIISDELGLTDSISRVAALLTWLALTIAVDIPAVRSEVAGGATEITVDSEVLQPAIKTEVE